MGERLNLIDRYDLTCMKDDINRDMIKLYNTEISPIKKSLQLHRSQIDGIGEIIMALSDEIDENKEKAIEDMRKTNFDKTRFDKLLLCKTNRLFEKINILEDKMINIEKILIVKFFYFCLCISIVYLILYFIF
jgi:hypothetical protein